MSHPPMLAMIGVYFSKHRGLANSIFFGSGPVGGLVFAPIVVKLFEEYAYTGTLLLVAGLFCHFFISAALMRSPAWYTNRHMKNRDKPVVEASQPLIEKSDCIQNGKTSPDEIFKSKDQHLQTWKSDQEMNGISDSEILEKAKPYQMGIQSPPALIRARSLSHVNKKDGTVSDMANDTSNSQSKFDRIFDAIDKSNSALYASAEGLHGSAANIQIPAMKEKEAMKGNGNKDNKTCCLSFKTGVIGILSTVFDCKLLKNIIFVQFLAMAFVAQGGMVIIPIYLPAYAKDAGISYNQIGIILSVMACVDLCSKLTTGVIADRKLVRTTTILGVAAMGTGTICHLARFFTNFPLLMTMSVILGMYNCRI